MTPDQVSEILRQLLKEALIVAAPILLSAALLSFLLSLAQTLTSLQEQSLTAVPRLFAVVDVFLVRFQHAKTLRMTRDQIRLA